MSQASQSQIESTGTPTNKVDARRSRSSRLPGQDLTLNETLRVMDLAREMRAVYTIALLEQDAQ